MCSWCIQLGTSLEEISVFGVVDSFCVGPPEAAQRAERLSGVGKGWLRCGLASHVSAGSEDLDFVVICTSWHSPGCVVVGKKHMAF